MRFERAGLEKLRTDARLRCWVHSLLVNPKRDAQHRMGDAVMLVTLIVCTGEDGKIWADRKRIRAFVMEHFDTLAEIVEEVVGEEEMRKLAYASLDATLQ